MGRRGNGGGLLYFAYGSNMKPERMMARVPGAHVIGVGCIRGWEVVERLYADIEKVTNGTTVGVVYEMSEAELKVLDVYEGCPTVYGRRWCYVHMADGSVRRAVVYALTEGARTDREGLPYPEWYRTICSDGARRFGLRNAFGVIGKNGKEVA